jgi:hemolysin activation/secretion protein
VPAGVGTDSRWGEWMRGFCSGVPPRPLAATLLAAAVVAVPGTALAQATPPPDAPPSVPTREQVELPSPDPERRPSRVRVDSADAIEAAPCPLDRFDVEVTINELVFSGVGGAELAPEIRQELAGIRAPGGGPQPISVVCGIRDRATAALRNAGYVASVQIPPQTVETGTLRLEVITARIVEVRVRGDAAPYRGTLTSRTEQLMALNPLNERDAERILLLAGDIPGLDVQLALRPAGTAPGEVIGDLTIAYTPYSLLANVQNYGSRQLGRETVYVRGEAYGLTGLADTTYVGASTTLDFEEQQVVQLGHITGLGDRGLTAEASFLYAWSRPDIGALDLRSESLVAGLELGLPLFRSVERNVRVSGGLELIEQRTRVFNAMGDGIPLNRDKLRVAFARLDGNYRMPYGTGDGFSVNWGLEFRKGLDIFDASERGEVSSSGFTPSRFEGDPQALVFRGDADMIIGMGPVFSLAGSGRVQWSSDALLNFEEFSLGNLTIGRGYDPGANSADRAIAVRIEPRAKVYDANNVRVDLFGFYDSIWIENLDTNAIEDDRRLSSYGGGVRAVLAGNAYLEAMYAYPEDKALLVPNARRAPDRFLISLTVQFAPGGR